MGRSVERQTARVTHEQHGFARGLSRYERVRKLQSGEWEFVLEQERALRVWVVGHVLILCVYGRGLSRGRNCLLVLGILRLWGSRGGREKRLLRFCTVS